MHDNICIFKLHAAWKPVPRDEQFVSLSNIRLLAAARAGNELPIRVLTATNTSLRILNTSSTFTLTLSIPIPKEGPVIRIRAQLTICRCSASVSYTSTVGSSMVGIVLVVHLEHGKGLCLGGSGVVTAFGGLDGFAGLCGTARG
jgi:hypothetical protein